MYSNLERQSDELEALKSMFPDQLTYATGGNESSTPLNIRLTLFPQRGSSGLLTNANIQIDLLIVASENYPDKVPDIKLENGKGLSTKNINELLKKLNDLAERRKGEVMVFALAQCVEVALLEYNHPEYASVHDEMITLQKQRELQESQVQKNDEDLQDQLMQLEVKGLLKQRRKKSPASKICAQIEIIPEEKDLKLIKNFKVKEEIIPTCENGESINQNEYLMSNFSISENARIVKEFKFLSTIGKGAYGEVLKVRNKLDDGLYAIKRIELNRGNKIINRKITREVKLLSRLNHENIVRYYNSWIENADDHAETKSVESHGEIPKRMADKKKDNLSFSFPTCGRDPSFSDEEDDDEANNSDSDWLSFQRSGSTSESNSVESQIKEDSAEARKLVEINVIPPLQFMYIQMEYCEKSTLRNAIDEDLYKDTNRVWRLLREIVDGLAYIHQQGIIHRDLKPVNIFIDHRDQVKIGDFGLAIPHNNPASNKDETSGKYDEKYKSSEVTHTGQVGTALYLAPELCAKDVSLIYNQKVDLYSLGIIFFEMCYKPLGTEMERIQVLHNLRKESRDLPPDFVKPDSKRQIILIRDLLKHNPKERPSAHELLTNERYIPATEPVEDTFNDMIRHTLANPQMRAYKYLLAECFRQTISPAEDITFDSFPSYGNAVWQNCVVEKLYSIACSVFKRHGAVLFNTPLLTPHNQVSQQEGVVTLMTKHGKLVEIPFDDRISFARYLVQNPTVTHCKRYTFNKVYRERRMFGTQPRELNECTFDIVTNNANNTSIEGEILYAVNEIIMKLQPLEKQFVVRLNHVSLVTGVMFANAVESQEQPVLLDYLNKLGAHNCGRGRDKYCPPKELVSFFSKSNVANTINTLNVDLQADKFAQHFASITAKKNKGATHCKTAIRQLESVLKYLQNVGFSLSLVISPSLVTNISWYSGVMLQVALDDKEKRQLPMEQHIIADGGRYDELVKTYKKSLNIKNDCTQSVAGVTIYLDRLVSLVESRVDIINSIDALICSVGKNDMEKDKAQLTSQMWQRDIRCSVLDVEQSLEETQTYCQEMRIPHIIYMKDTEPGYARIRSWNKDKFLEKRKPIAEVAEYLSKLIKPHSGGVTSNGFNLNADFTSANVASRPETRPRSGSSAGDHSHNLNIHFVTEEKINANNKRRLENLIMNAISLALTKISSRMIVDVIAINVDSECVQALEWPGLDNLIKKFPRYKKILGKLRDFMEDQCFNKVNAFIFYSLLSNTYKVIL